MSQSALSKSALSQSTMLMSTRRARRSSCGALLLLAAGACSRSDPPPSPTSPPSAAAPTAPTTNDRAQNGRPQNVLLVSFDTTRADALGCYAPRTPSASPNLDALAQQSVLFESAFSPVPITLPAHTTMLTGLDPARHSVRDNGIYDVPAAAQTLPELLKAEGRRTFAVVGSIVLLARYQLSQGFDVWDDHGLVVTGGDEHERQADAVAAAALPLLAASEPFFGFVHFYDAHQPYRAPADLVAKYGDPYLAEIAFADRALGRLLDALKESGRLERTIVVVTADHGEGRGEHGETSHGMLLHDATQHVPLVIRVPGAPARRESAQVALADLTPTLLDLLAVAPPPELDGRSLAAAFHATAGGAADALDDADAYLESISPQLSYDFAPLFGLRTREWKLVLGARPHLWHLVDDAKELKDVAADHPDVVAALTRKLLHLRDGRGPALDRDLRAVTGEELKVFGGLGYVSSGSVDAVADASGRPDPYDAIGATDELAKAGLLADANRLDEAIAVYRKLVAAYPGCYAAQNGLGVAYGRKGDHGQALDHLLAAAAIHGGSPDLQMQIALAAFLAKKPEQVAPHLELAIARPNCPPRAYFMLWEIRGKSGDARGARAILEQLLQRKDLAAADRTQAEQLLKGSEGRKNP